jgi:peptide-methionine (R)-S-oxide reductase
MLHAPVYDRETGDGEMTFSRRAFLSGSAMAVIGGAFATTACAKAKPAEKFEVMFSDAGWRKRLTPAQFSTLRQEATDVPGQSPFLKEHRPGMFSCAGCALPVYPSKTKYDSGTGWPSFWQAMPNAIRTRTDYALGFPRTEVHCRRCGGHLGHVFDDGPKPTGKRHCINGTALTFKPGVA